jgi:vacuolar-type H+-ATPase subunit I/STV1
MLTGIKLDQIQDFIQVLPQALRQYPEIANTLESILGEQFPRRDKNARLLDELKQQREETTQQREEQREETNRRLDQMDLHLEQVREVIIARRNKLMVQAATRRNTRLKSFREKLLAKLS